MPADALKTASMTVSKLTMNDGPQLNYIFRGEASRTISLASLYFYLLPPKLAKRQIRMCFGDVPYSHSNGIRIP